MQKFAVVYFPKGNIETINSLRQKNDPNVHLLQPHITLVSPISEISENELVVHVQHVVKEVQPFRVRLKGLHKTDDNLLFLLVKEGNEKINYVHDSLYSGILHSYLPTDYPFVPHITLGSLDHADLLKDAEKAQINVECEFDSISIIQGDGINPAGIIKTIPFTNAF